MSAFRRKYATATHVYVPMIKRGVVDFAVGADWTPASTDVKVSIDGGAAANITSLPTAVAMGNTAYWDFSLTSGEMTGKKISITVGDAATKAVEDQMIVIETYGHASAEWPTDLSAAKMAVNAAQIGGSDQTAGLDVTATWTATRAALIDKLNITGNVAGSAEVTAIQNNTRAVIVVPAVIERPDSGTETYKVHLYLYDETGNMEAPDSAPTVTLVNSAGTSRASRLASTTGTLVNTGHYSWTYTNTSTDTLEQLLWEFTVVKGGTTRLFGRDSLLVDTTAVDFTSADRTTLQAAATATALSAVASSVSGLDTKLGSPAAGSVSADVAAVKADTASLLGRVTSTLFSGITSVAKWLGCMSGKTSDPTTQAEINATTAGAGFVNTTDSLQALRDNYTTGGDTVVVAPVTATVPNNTITTSGTTDCYQYCAFPVGPIPIVDGADRPIDLGAYSVKMIATSTINYQLTFTLTNATSDGLAIGGADNNEVSVDYVSEVAGTYKWEMFIKNTGETNWTKIAFGFWNIIAGADPR